MSDDIKIETDQIESNKVEPKKKVKKKKHMRWWGILLIIFFSIIIGIPLLGVCAVYACFFDAGHTEITVKQNYTTNDVINEIMVDAFDGATTNEHTVKIGIMQDQMNQVLYNAISSKPELKEYINNLYVDINNNKVQLVLEAGAFNIFKTKLFITMSFGESEDQSELIFTIDDIKLGRIGGMQGMVGFVKQFVELPDLTQTFANAGFHVKVDLEKFTMTYKLTDFYHDLSKLLGSETNVFMQLLEELLLNRDLLELESAKDNTIFAFKLDIDNLRVTSNTHGIENYTIPDGYFNSQFKDVKTTLTTLLNGSKINESDATLVANYLMGGKKVITSSSDLEKIEKYEANGVFADYQSNIPYYKGYESTEESSLESIVEKQINSSILVGDHFDIVIPANTLDNIFASTTALGNMTIFKRDLNLGVNNTKNYKVNHISLSRITTLIKNNSLYLVINLNLNGYDAHITLKADNNEIKEFGKIEFDIDSMSLGDVAVTPSTMDIFMDIIDDALSGQSFNGLLQIADGKISLNIAQILGKNLIDTSLFGSEFLLSDSTSSNPGNITLRITKNFSLL